MKRLLIVCLIVILLTGCGGENAFINQAIDLRSRISESNECSFLAVVTADYGDSVYTFSMDCKREHDGSMTMTVTAPDTISGITAHISKGTGQLTFEDKALAFEMVADGQITPVSAPWLFMEALSGGFISTCGKDGAGMRIQIDDSYAGMPLDVDIWTGEDQLPVRAEMIWQGRRIVSIDIKDFVMM